MDQLPGQILWEEIREARQKGLTKQGNRYIRLNVFKGRPVEQNTPARIYETDFQNCFFWVLGGILPNGYIANEEEKLRYESSYGPPLPLYHIIPYLTQLLGEKLETVYGFSALLDDYQYLQDLITHGLLGLQQVPPNLTHAHGWLTKQIERLEAINLATGIADASRTLLEQNAHSNTEYIDPAISPYEWQGSATELVELGYALLESKLIDATGQREQFVQTLALFFGKHVGDNPAKTIDQIKGRKKEPVTSRLKAALESYLTSSKSDRTK